MQALPGLVKKQDLVMKHDNYSNFVFHFSIIILKKNQQQETRIYFSCFDFTAH